MAGNLSIGIHKLSGSPAATPKVTLQTYNRSFFKQQIIKPDNDHTHDHDDAHSEGDVYLLDRGDIRGGDAADDRAAPRRHDHRMCAEALREEAGGHAAEPADEEADGDDDGLERFGLLAVKYAYRGRLDCLFAHEIPPSR